MRGLGIGFSIPEVADLSDRYGAFSTIYDFAGGYYRRGGLPATTFPAQILASLATHTRASQALVPVRGRRVLPFAVDVPAITADGLLIEGAATNVLQQSQALENATWGKALLTATADQGTAPDGTMTADKLADSATTNGAHLIQQQRTITAGAAQTVSLFAKAVERPYVQLALDTSDANGCYANFDLINGTVVASGVAGTGTLLGATITALADGWYWCTLTGIAAPAGTNGRMFANVLRAGNQMAGFGGGGVGTVGAGILAWQADMKAEAAPSSPIVTAGASASRAAVACTVVVPAGVSSYRLTHDGGMVEGAATPGANFDLGAGSGGAWVGRNVRQLLFR